MKTIYKKTFSYAIILFLIFFISVYIINTGLITLDDMVYKNSFNSFSTCLNWTNEFYHLWSGRITLTILINIFTNLPIQIFRIVNSLVFMIMILAMYKIIVILEEDFSKEIKNILLTIIFCLIFYISIPVINSGTIWLAGAMNYLWPLVAMLVAIIPFVKLIKDKQIKNTNI